MECYIPEFPEKCFLHILKHLDAPSLCSIMKVSRRMSQLGRTCAFWKPLLQADFGLNYDLCPDADATHTHGEMRHETLKNWQLRLYGCEFDGCCDGQKQWCVNNPFSLNKWENGCLIEGRNVHCMAVLDTGDSSGKGVTGLAAPAQGQPLPSTQPESRQLDAAECGRRWTTHKYRGYLIQKCARTTGQSRWAELARWPTATLEVLFVHVMVLFERGDPIASRMFGATAKGTYQQHESAAARKVSAARALAWRLINHHQRVPGSADAICLVVDPQTRSQTPSQTPSNPSTGPTPRPRGGGRASARRFNPLGCADTRVAERSSLRHAAAGITQHPTISLLRPATCPEPRGEADVQDVAQVCSPSVRNPPPSVVGLVHGLRVSRMGQSSRPLLAGGVMITAARLPPSFDAHLSPNPPLGPMEEYTAPLLGAGSTLHDGMEDAEAVEAAVRIGRLPLVIARGGTPAGEWVEFEAPGASHCTGPDPAEVYPVEWFQFTSPRDAQVTAVRSGGAGVVLGDETSAAAAAEAAEGEEYNVMDIPLRCTRTANVVQVTLIDSEDLTWEWGNARDQAPRIYVDTVRLMGVAVDLGPRAKLHALPRAKLLGCQQDDAEVATTPMCMEGGDTAAVLLPACNTAYRQRNHNASVMIS